ncbi:MAG: DinB family protein [Acidobacteriota bacterium]
MSLTSTLEAGRKDFLEAVHEISAAHASTKPSPTAWCVLEIVEHVAFVEGRFQGWIANGAEVAPDRNSDKELSLFSQVRSRLTKVEAPEAVRPTGRFATLEEALAEFNAARDRSIQLVTDRADSLYSIGVKHPRFGDMNGAELVHIIDGHARRHAEQIRETHQSLSNTP